MNIVKNTVIIIFAAIIFAVGNFFINPNQPNLSLKPDELTIPMTSRLPANLIIVDARNEKEFAAGHIENAINLSEEKFDTQLGAFLDVWNPDSAILVYCSSSGCNSSRSIAERLKNECQIMNVFILKDDWTKWKTLK